MDTQWESICNILQKTLKSGDYKVWIAPLKGRVEDNTVFIATPSSYARNWIQRCFAEAIHSAAAQALGSDVKEIHVNFTVAEELNNTPLRETADSPSVQKTPCTQRKSAAVLTASSNNAHYVYDHSGQMSLPLPYQSPLTKVHWRHDFTNFVVGPSNALANAAAHDICRESIETLFVSASSGLGKTHLIHAIGQSLAHNGRSAKVGYLTAEDFSAYFVRSIKNRQMDSFKASLRDLDVLLLEDVHHFQGKEKTQDEALATIKSLQNKGKRVVLTSSFSPKELLNVDSQLVSHFCSGVLANIGAPTRDMCRDILQQKAHAQKIALPSIVADLLVEHMQDDVRQLESCLKNLLYKAQLLRCDITLELAMDVLAQFMPVSSMLDMERIIALVCASYKLTEEQLTSRSRRKAYVLARDTIYYLARKHTKATLEEIGRRFNRRHSTVVKGISTIERQLQSQGNSGRQVASTLQLIERNAGI